MISVEKSTGDTVKRKLSKHLKPEELDVWRKFHKRGCGQYVKCKLDQVNLDINTTKGHKLGILKLATKAIKNGEHFITEAVPNDNTKRRVDLVNLTTNTNHEIETDKKVKKPGAKTTYVKKNGKRSD